MLVTTLSKYTYIHGEVITQNKFLEINRFILRLLKCNVKLTYRNIIINSTSNI